MLPVWCRLWGLISIPALREESDPAPKINARTIKYFYPRPPRGERHKVAPHVFLAVHISIPALREESDVHEQVTSSHTGISIPALREESDSIVLINFFDLLYFYPRPPRGERLQLTNGKRAAIPISIPALREESDLQCLVTWSSHRYFYPRPPRGERQQKQRQNLYFQTNYTTFCTNLEEL